MAQKFDEHQFYISNGINRPTNTEVTILMILTPHRYIDVYAPTKGKVRVVGVSCKSPALLQGHRTAVFVIAPGFLR